MRKRRRPYSEQAINLHRPLEPVGDEVGLVLSGGGARAAYQVGALRALTTHFGETAHPFSTIVGSSIGAVNGLVLGASLQGGLTEGVDQLTQLWRERTYRNSFAGSPSKSFFKAILVAMSQLRAPGPNSTNQAIFDPTPLMQRVDQVIQAYGGLTPEGRHPSIKHLGIMTTLEGSFRKPLLFLSSHKHLSSHVVTGASFEVMYVDSLTAKHGFASAALPSVLPPVEIDSAQGKLRLVDGGIAQNHPVDPAVRLGSESIVLIDVSGRNWWNDRAGTPHDEKPSWEVPAKPETFCLRPSQYFVSRCMSPLGPILREAVGRSTKKFISAVGPVWPVFSLLKNKLGEEVAYEVMTYVALDQDYLNALMERGYYETKLLLKKRPTPALPPSVEMEEHLEREAS